MKGGSRVAIVCPAAHKEAVPRGPRRYLRPVAEQHVAADPADVDGELADRLAGVEQIQDAVPRGDLAHLRGRIDEAALCRSRG
jgi:hypothetical protein